MKQSMLGTDERSAQSSEIAKGKNRYECVRIKKSLEVLEDFSQKINSFSSSALDVALEHAIELMKMEIAREESRSNRLKEL